MLLLFMLHQQTIPVFLIFPFQNVKLPFRHYAGYVNVNQTVGRNLFYWFVESRGNPATDPLMLWLQGGPGCSSLLGFFTENGPFQITNNQQIVLNAYAWNKNVSIIYLESPAGVGLSYNANGQYYNSDDLTSHDSYTFMQLWLQLYPEYQKNDFYIAGESYGGHYVPQLAYTILMGNSKNTIVPINLKGILVGNPYTDDNIDSYSVPVFIFYHHLCSIPTYQNVEQACLANFSLDLSAPFHDRNPQRLKGKTADCQAALDVMFDEVTPDINQFNIYWACVENITDGFDCEDETAVTTYLNRADVLQAIHAKKPAQPWFVCTDVNYQNSWPSVIPIYPYIMDRIKVMVYAGDVTFNVPALGTEVWVQKLGRKPVGGYRTWNYNGQVAGYYQRFDGITYVTVKGSGHMVPEYTPGAAEQLLKNYLSGFW